MTIKFSAGDEEPADVQATTEAVLKDAAENLARLINQIKAGNYAAAKETPAAAKGVTAAFQSVQEERGRVDKLRKQVAGTVGARALDFHSARDEIGRRLARLRDAEPG